LNFEKYFPKTIYKGKIEFLKGLVETWGGGRENIDILGLMYNNHCSTHAIVKHLKGIYPLW
jgi:hypothetical protein